MWKPSSGSITDEEVAVGAGIQSDKLSYLRAATGSQARSIRSKLSERITPQDFGAKGDGITDDTLAIQRAIAAAVAIGAGVVWILPGTYGVSQTIVLPNGVSLFGECGAPSFPELNAIAVSQFKWIGAAGGVVCQTAAGWAGRIDNIQFNANGLAATCQTLVGIGGCLFNNVRWVNSMSLAVDWHSQAGKPSSLNTFVNCVSADHQGVGFQMSGLSNGAVTLNTFIGCRFSGKNLNLRILQFADTNTWFGGRVEGGIQYGLVVNEAGGGLNSDSLLFSGVTFDGSGVADSAMCYIGPPISPLPPGGGSTVVTFRDCHMTESGHLNAGPVGANIKVIDCPAFAMMYGSVGDYVPAQDVTVTASPFTYTNNDPYAENVIISGGTISGITFIRNGVSHALGLSSGSFVLNPGDAIQISYSVTPAVFTRWQI
ncbi:hypothetical protein CEY04_27940 [Achromobacter sp. HZ28]|nr:hypothetical protein CEY05_29110 [Achromobacter sp. HZ34]OWT70092.1 hypothetical protein CEY04_27940 [Achromobacter sp. HZ28]